MKNTQELPKWFIKGGGQIYTQGDDVENVFSGESIKLNNLELSMYDYIKGAELVAYQTNDTGIIHKFNKALGWFRKANPSAYMVLLD